MLSVRYELAYAVQLPNGNVIQLTDETPLIFTETRGAIVYYCLPGPFTPEGVEALNVVAAQMLSGKQWFQLWGGEIVSMESPESDGGNRGGIHRGPLVDQASGSGDR